MFLREKHAQCSQNEETEAKGQKEGGHRNLNKKANGVVISGESGVVHRSPIGRGLEFINQQCVVNEMFEKTTEGEGQRQKQEMESGKELTELQVRGIRWQATDSTKQQTIDKEKSKEKSMDGTKKGRPNELVFAEIGKEKED